jgi:hypothetical protein
MLARPAPQLDLRKPEQGAGIEASIDSIDYVRALRNRTINRSKTGDALRASLHVENGVRALRIFSTISRSVGLSHGFGPPADLALPVGLSPKIGIPRGSAHEQGP